LWAIVTAAVLFIILIGAIAYELTRGDAPVDAVPTAGGDRVLVTVNGQPITRAEFESVLEREGIFEIVTPPTKTTKPSRPDSSGFGTKAHALLCRKYVKGRDWYDFVWYTSRRVAPDLGLLRNALLQQGPWAGRPLERTPDWLFENLGAAIRRINWRAASSDVRRFVPTVEQPGLDAWSTDFFLYQLGQLKGVMRGR